MKSFALCVVFAQLAIFQSYAQFIRPAPFLPNVFPGPIVAPGSCGCSGPVLPPVIAGPTSVIAAPSSVIAAPPSVIAAPPSVIAAQSPFVLQPNSVANSLADTLSLLTVSSLLADSLPLGYSNIVGLPSYPSYGCGLNYIY